MKIAPRFILPLAAIGLAFYLPLFFIENTILKILFYFAIAFAVFIYSKGIHKIDFNPKCQHQKTVFAFVIAILIIFSFIVCAVSIEKEWMHKYPFEDSVDKYGCYPQMFDAFQKGQLNIDTDYDLSIIDALENPYDTAARRKATGEKYGVLWDRAYFEGKIYSYFGIAPVIFLYYPVYYLTGAVLSDALAAAIMVAVACIFLMLVLWELCARIKGKVPFILIIFGGVALTCGSLLWSTQTCANFYHLAVLSGICSVSAFFYFVLRAEREKDGFKRKLLFVISGITVAAIVASRPNMVLYTFIAFPLLINIIIQKPYGKKSLWKDIAAIIIPMLALGGLIMWYNHARFGSVFDFGSAYQLTLTDTSTYSFSGALFLPSIYHFFINPPKIDDVFPYLHPINNRLESYNVTRYVYVDKTVGAVFFPAVWGSLLLPVIYKEKTKIITGAITVISVIFIAFFDMCYAGSHLRYSADIMFILTLLGVYMLIYAVSVSKKGKFVYICLYTLAIVLFVLTFIIELPISLDNERDMIRKFHSEFYNFLAM